MTNFQKGHWGHQDLRLYYNGLQHEEISGPNPTNHNGLDREFVCCIV